MARKKKAAKKKATEKKEVKEEVVKKKTKKKKRKIHISTRTPKRLGNIRTLRGLSKGVPRRNGKWLKSI